MFDFDPKFSIEVWLHHNVPSFTLSIVAILANASVIDLSNNDLSNNARCMLVVASHVNTFAC